MHINDPIDAFVLHGEVEVIVAVLSIVFQAIINTVGLEFPGQEFPVGPKCPGKSNPTVAIIL